MSKIVNEAKKQIKTIILEAVGKAVAEGRLPAEPMNDFNIEVPADRNNGDYSSNAAMANAKVFRLPPRKIADTMKEFMEIEGTYFSNVEIAGPGFINFYLSDKYYADILLDIKSCGDNYGRSNYGAGKKVNVEFVSANPTGPMHMGNARGGALGDCLAAVLDYAGYEVAREFYVNDAGNQIDKFALSLDVRYQQIFKGEDAVELPEDSYHGADIMERAKQFADKYGDAYLEKDEKERRKALVEFALPLNIANMKSAMAKYRIDYDLWFSELSLHNGTELKETLDILKNNGYTYEKDGALWYKNIEVQTKILKEQGKSDADIEKLELKDDVLIRANGNPTYFLADIAYHRNKFTRGFDKAIDVWGADHHGHVARMKGAMEAIGISSDRLDVVLMQLVRLMKDGQPVKMSKRTGKAITLTDLLDEVPIDAVRFLFNMREAGSTMDFDLDLAVEQSSQNPVYYCQYAHARICSILRKLSEEQGVTAKDCTQKQLMLLNTSEEKELIRHLSSLTDTVVSAAKSYDPAKMTHFVLDLATLFHKFYNACRVSVDDEDLMQARLYLCVCVKDTIRNVLKMLKIDAPEKM